MHKQLNFHDCFTSYVVILTALTGPPSQVLSFVAPIGVFALLGAVSWRDFGHFLIAL
jgi:hypothetical protein